MRRPLLFGCICLFVSIALWTQLKNPLPLTGDVTGWDGQTVLLTGQVYEKEYRVSNGEKTQVLYLKSILYSTEADASYFQIKQASGKLSEINPAENLICEVSLSAQSGEKTIPALGSEVFLQGEWQSMTHATNPGEFDTANYYMIEGIGARLKNVRVLAIGESKWPIRETLYRLRQHFQQNLYSVFEEKEASILAKMLLGVGAGLDEEVHKLYQENGIVHILSISGLHITLLGMGVYKLLRYGGCPIALAAIFGGFTITGYGIMTGFGVSACRAIGMYLLRMLGEIWGKTYDMLTAMGVLAVIMLAENPVLVYHSGFLLSFSSVCGVGLLSPLLQLPAEWFRRLPGEQAYISLGKKQLQKLSAGFSVSLAVTLFTLPIQLFFFFKIPVYSVFINLLVIPMMSVVMSVGIAVMLLPGLHFLCPIEVGIFQWFEWLCYRFEQLPGHTLITGRPDMWIILIYYILIIGLILAGKRLQSGMRGVFLTALVLLMLLRESDSFKITVLDVGQGECICVQTVEGKCYLFDGGSSSRQNVGERVILPFLQFEGIEKVDAVFLSHPDTDHYNGIRELLASGEIIIDTVYLPAAGSAKEWTAILEAAGKAQVQYVSKGDRWKMGDMLLTCLHPEKNFEADSNACSACYLLEMDGFRMLFTADVEGQGEEAFISGLRDKNIKAVEVLKVAHHGSRNATSPSFLDEVDMRLAVISCGRNNSYGHPHEEVLERLATENCDVRVTAKAGAITIEVDKEKIKISGFCKE